MPRRHPAAFLVATLLLLPACSSGGDDLASETPPATLSAAVSEVAEDGDPTASSTLAPDGSADTAATGEEDALAAEDSAPTVDDESVATAAASRPDEDVVAATDGRLATITMGTQGGLCPEGVCSRHVIVDEADQAWSASTSAGESSEGEVEAAAVDALARLIESHWAALTATPFEGDCPTAHDGQERVLDLAFAPVDGTGDRVSQSTSSCTHAWPADVVAEIDAAWDDAGLPR